ncbi:related to Pre-mRNA-splicing factor PRP46 [Saccharomycodes ludwigii]|uniref:Pre-mRNA-splicing factor PRP46 n=1 Tax=Saccharomycodes ludwigii TaxID=36035 RepID=A0A376B1M7_9ASCO|nr:hypothetical protein SCDLUD_002153 [Saccharomycodes ludwigii]KAH3902333.1 hypothetical protein SCDLUD_002153 [Saccharomycodes ludwigii]SSD58529.1 related to Pre-mRNA-splicing factor PRP46 [Saccharomycodes ludwigii]
MEDISSDNVYNRIKWDLKYKYLAHLPEYLQNKLETSGISEKDTDKIEEEKTYDKQIDENINKDDTWELVTMLGGHSGWIRTVKVDPVYGQWIASGSADASIKIWSLLPNDEGHHLKTTLNGHTMSVRDIAISDRHPYMFSCSEDKTVKCWDLEHKSIIRDYHGHLSGVYTVCIHPTLDLIMTAGRDSVVRVWDIRTKRSVMTLTGHKNSINKVLSSPVDPQVISCSNDNTIKLWDLVSGGKQYKTLTVHSKSVRDICLNPSEFSFASCSTNQVFSWKLPEGLLLSNFSKNRDIGLVNTLSCSYDGTLFGGCDNGEMLFYDYKSGKLKTSFYGEKVKGILSGETGILSSTFNKKGDILITGEMDKFVKIWSKNKS